MTIERDYEALVDRKLALLRRQATLSDAERTELHKLCERIDTILGALYPGNSIDAVRRQMRAKHDSQPTLQAVRPVK